MVQLRRADTQNPTPTRKRFPHSTLYECLKAFFRHARFFNAPTRNLPMFKKPPTFFRHVCVFKTCVFAHLNQATCAQSARMVQRQRWPSQDWRVTCSMQHAARWIHLFSLANAQLFSILASQKSQSQKSRCVSNRKMQIAGFAAEKPPQITKKNRSDFGGAEQNRSVYAFSKSQRFRDCTPPSFQKRRMKVAKSVVFVKFIGCRAIIARYVAKTGCRTEVQTSGKRSTRTNTGSPRPPAENVLGQKSPV